MSAAAALFVTTFEMRNVARYTATRSPTRPVLEISATRTSVAATVPATPEFCNARDMPNAAAMVTMTSHLTASRASCSESAPHAIMMAAAKRRSMSSTHPDVYTAIIATAMRSTGTNRRRRGGAESSRTDTSANPLPEWPASRWKSGPASRSKTSPGWSTVPPAEARGRVGPRGAPPTPPRYTAIGT